MPLTINKGRAFLPGLNAGVSGAKKRMIGANFLSRRSTLAKALTATSTGAPSTAIPEAVRPHVAVATGGEVTGLADGLQVRFDGVLLGGIGVGSGSPEQDLTVALAAPAAISAEGDEPPESRPATVQNDICTFIAWFRSEAS